MASHDEPQPRVQTPPDTGLRRLLIWTFVALAVAVLLSILGVSLAVYWLDK